MKKALGQTVRDIKREVNKKVLKVPSIEQKVLDATSNEPWGPHGSLLADIAQASRNYHEYQMIMSVIWKRVNDTGKNWRHVYKALTVLDYLVAHGSERVIDDIREHAYQIQTLSDFQYIDSTGRDQGNNVRKKSQSLVVLVNDKERIQEVRQKAAANKEKYRNTSAGSMYRPGSGGYGDDRSESRYGNRDDDRNGYGRERDDDRYSYGREQDRYSRDSEDRYGRDGYKDDDYRGRSQSMDDYNYGPRSRSVDPDRDRAYEDDGQYSSRGSGAKADDHSQDGSTSSKRLERRYSEQNLGAPPSYEDAVGPAQSPTNVERDRESSVASALKPSSSAGASPSYATDASPPPFPASPPSPAPAVSTAQDNKGPVDDFDEFDPRGPFAVMLGNAEMDLLGTLSESFSSNSLALVPTNEPSMVTEANAPESFHSGPSFAANSSTPVSNQPFDDPFGDGPFKAVPTSEGVIAHQQSFVSTQKPGGEFGDAFYGNSGVQSPPAPQQFGHQEPSALGHEIDILADILPPSGYPVQAGQSVAHGGFPPQANESELHSQLPSFPGHSEPQNSFHAQAAQSASFPTQPGQPSLHTNYHPQSAEPVLQNNFMGQSLALTYPVHSVQPQQMGVHSQNGQPTPLPGYPPQMGAPQYGAPHLAGPNTSNSNFYGNYPPQNNSLSQPSAAVPVAPQMVPQAPQMQSSIPMAPMSVTPASTVSSAIVPQPSKEKFETKSTVWADTLSRGLVNLNISGSKINPLNDIGVDFDAINRKEKRMEKPTTTSVTSTITMGKAMGSGSGMGRAGAGAIRPAQNSMAATGMNSATAGMPAPGMNMGGYGASQPMGRGGMGMGMGMNMPGNVQMGMGMNMPGNMQMGMGMNNMPGNMQIGMGMNNMGMAQGVHAQQQARFPPTPGMPGGYNPMMGSGNYGQQPYGGGYR